MSNLFSEFVTLPRHAKLAVLARIVLRLEPLIRQSSPSPAAGLMADIAVHIRELMVGAGLASRTEQEEYLQRHAEANLTFRINPLASNGALQQTLKRLDPGGLSPEPLHRALWLVRHSWVGLASDVGLSWAIASYSYVALFPQPAREAVHAVTRNDMEQARNAVANDAPLVSRLGVLWPDFIVGSIPSVVDATERVQRLMGPDFRPMSSLNWSFRIEAESPVGYQLQLVMREWNLEITRVIRWAEMADERQLQSAVIGVWDDMLKIRLKQIRATANVVLDDLTLQGRGE